MNQQNRSEEHEAIKRGEIPADGNKAKRGTEAS